MITGNHTLPAPSNQSFALDLGDGTHCVAIIEGRPATLRFAWTGKLNASHSLNYFRWVSQVYQALADTRQQGVRVLFRLTPEQSLVAIYKPKKT